jgi:hypothetical protein
MMIDNAFRVVFYLIVTDVARNLLSMDCKPLFKVAASILHGKLHSISQMRKVHPARFRRNLLSPYSCR